MQKWLKSFGVEIINHDGAVKNRSLTTAPLETLEILSHNLHYIGDNRRFSSAKTDRRGGFGTRHTFSLCVSRCLNFLLNVNFITSLKLGCWAETVIMRTATVQTQRHLPLQVQRWCHVTPLQPSLPVTLLVYTRQVLW